MSYKRIKDIENEINTLARLIMDDGDYYTDFISIISTRIRWEKEELEEKYTQKNLLGKSVTAVTEKLNKLSSLTKRLNIHKDDAALNKMTSSGDIFFFMGKIKIRDN